MTLPGMLVLCFHSEQSTSFRGTSWSGRRQKVRGDDTPEPG
jgi:hypothetical protein